MNGKDSKMPSANSHNNSYKFNHAADNKNSKNNNTPVGSAGKKYGDKDHSN